MAVKILQAELTTENAAASVAFLQDKITLMENTKNGITDFSIVSEILTSEDLQYWLDNNIKVELVPNYLEMPFSTKDMDTPAIFPNREVNVYDEEGEIIGTRILKVHEYFRYWELGEELEPIRFFIELVKSPKYDPNVAIGTQAIENLLNVQEIQTVRDTFAGTIIASYTRPEFLEVLGSNTELI